MSSRLSEFAARAIVLATALVALQGVVQLWKPNDASAYGLNGCRSARLAADVPERYATGEGMTSWYGAALDKAAPMWWRAGTRGGHQRNANFDILVIRRAVVNSTAAMTAYWQSCNLNGYFAGSRTIVVNSNVSDGRPEREILNLFVHEFGHHMGLDHTTYGCGTAVMNKAPGACFGYPDAPWSDDMAGYHHIYG